METGCPPRENLQILGVVGVAHVAGVAEGVVECERGFERVGRLTRCAQFEIVAEEFAVHGVGAVVDNSVGALDGIFVAEVGDALVGDEDVDAMLAVVGVCYHRDDVAYHAAFGY